jgi:uncharacterized Zn finger protein (UPF0148 family)
MGFFNALKNILGGEKCPVCGTPGVRKSGSEIRCLNPVCQYFNPSFAPSGSSPQRSPQPPQQAPQQAQPPQGHPSGWSSAPSSTPAGSGPAPAGSVTIQYRNFQGQNKTFYADARSLHREKNHIRATVAPRSQQISLSRDRIQNLQEVERQMPQRVEPGQDWPNKKERQVLGYHKKHGTTSALYEKIRAKYPKW